MTDERNAETHLYDESEVQLELKSRVFAFGILPLSPSSCNIKALLKLAQLGQVKKRNKSLSTSLTSSTSTLKKFLKFSDWKKWASDKENFDISDDIAWTYFETFDLVSGGSRLRLTEKEHDCKNKTDIDKLHDKIRIPLIEFLIFLFIQKFPHSSVTTIDVFEHVSRPKTPEEKNAYAEHLEGLVRNRFQFVRKYLEDILSLLLHLDTFRAGVEGNVRIPAHHVVALDWLFDVQHSSKATLSEIILHQNLRQALGFSKDTETFVLPNLVTWMRDRLAPPMSLAKQEPKPFIYRASLLSLDEQQDLYKSNKETFKQHQFKRSGSFRHSATLSSPSSSGHFVFPSSATQVMEESLRRSGVIVANPYYTPLLLSMTSSRLLTLASIQATVQDSLEAYAVSTNSATQSSVIARLSKATLRWEESEREDAIEMTELRDLHIFKCSVSVLYLLAPFRNVKIEDCVRCTIVLGPVAGTVFVSNTKLSTIIVPCVRFISSDCIDCNVFLCTNTRPLILRNTQNLVLAPYNTFYDKLARHMEVANLFPHKNEWNNPLIISSKSATAACSLMPAHQFCPFIVPFLEQQDEDSKQDVPLHVPDDYLVKMKDNVGFVAKFKQQIQEANMDDATKASFEAFVQEQFMEWLMRTKRLRQVHQLIVHKE
eukprot:m.17910 g.17910  ORF g.17910 m.17910 type:complete len:654 (-) comp4858_c0_seq1:89-2050(-)